MDAHRCSHQLVSNCTTEHTYSDSSRVGPLEDRYCHTHDWHSHPYAGASQFADATAKTKAQANEQLKQARSSMTKLWKNWKEGGNEKSIASSSAENLPEPFSNETCKYIQLPILLLLML